MKELSIFIALGAGFLSFFSPCVLPLIPAYISFITGLSLEELGAVGDEKRGQIRRILVPSLLFILGFSFIFVALGASITFLGSLLFAWIRPIKFVGGAIVILFGLSFLGLFNIGFLQYEKKLQFKDRPTHLAGAALAGMAFAFAWTPCVGPILASILTLAATERNVNQGILLLSFYSLGLGIPFLGTSLAVGTFLNVFKKIKDHLRIIHIICGVLLLIVGVMIIARA